MGRPRLGFCGASSRPEAAYWIINRIAGPFPAGTGFQTYFYYVRRQLFWSLPILTGGQPVLKLSFFPKLYMIGQGIPFVVLLLAAMGYCVWTLLKRRDNTVFVLVCFQGLLMPLLWILNPGVVAIRAVEFLLPFQALMIGSFLSSLQNRWIKLGLMSVFMISVMPHSWKPLREESGYRQAAHFLNAAARGQLLVLNETTTWRYVLGPGKLWKWWDTPLTWDRLDREVREGTVRYAAFDYKDLLLEEEDKQQIVSDIRSRLKPAAVFSNSMACDPLNVMDQVDLDKLVRVREACTIEIYDLKAAFH